MKIALISDKLPQLPAELTEKKDMTFSLFHSEKAVTPTDWFEYEAAYLLEPYGEAAVRNWTGHPHLRAVADMEALAVELQALTADVECERKFLVEYPDLQALEKYHPYRSKIEQIYLVNPNATHRLRKRTADGVTAYIETIKIRQTSLKCTELERTLTKAEYEELLPLTDPAKHPVVKDRYCFLYQGQYFELDVFSFWKDRAVVELELSNENAQITLPPELTLLKEVTDDVRYKNNYMAGADSYDYY
ncbi:MAG: CYTH domain-containing protein [Eubacterium sp.]|nr:CYTH domain-containing protein [Eubacterium sp.]